MYYPFFYRLLCVLLITLIPVQTTLALARGGGDSDSVESIERKEKDRVEPIESDDGEEQNHHRTQTIAVLNQMFQGSPHFTEAQFQGRRIDWEKSHKIFSYFQKKLQSREAQAGGNIQEILSSKLSEEEARDPDILLANKVIVQFANLSAIQTQGGVEHEVRDGDYTDVCEVGHCGPKIGKFPKCYPNHHGKCCCSEDFFECGPGMCDCRPNNIGGKLVIYHVVLIVVQAASLLSFIGAADRCPEKYHPVKNDDQYCKLDSGYENSTYPEYRKYGTDWAYVRTTGYVELGLASLHILPYLVLYSPYIVGNTLALGWKLGSVGCGLIYNGAVGIKNLCARGISNSCSWISKKYTQSQINHCERDIEKNLEKLGKETGFTEFSESFDGLMKRMVNASVN